MRNLLIVATLKSCWWWVGGWWSEILTSALVLWLLFLIMEDLEIDMYMFFIFDIDPILTMIRQGLDCDRTRTRTRAWQLNLQVYIFSVLTPVICYCCLTPDEKPRTTLVSSTTSLTRPSLELDSDPEDEETFVWSKTIRMLLSERIILKLNLIARSIQK